MDWELFKDETTTELLAGMTITGQSGNTEVSDAIFWAFIIRFRERVQKKCRVIARKMGYDDAFADDVAAKSFQKFRNCTTFKGENCKNLTLDDCVEIYIGQIAARLLYDHRENEQRPKIEIPENEIFWELPDLEVLGPVSERKAQLQHQHDIIKKALDSLPPSHRAIYLTYSFYEKFTSDGQNIPRSITKRLREEFNLTQTSIRVYKKAAFDKVALYLKLHGNN